MFALYYRTLDLSTPLYIGGLEPHIVRSEHISSTSYTGCLSQVTMGETLLDLASPLRAGGVVRGCPPVEDHCPSSQCVNGGLGECVSVWDGTVCDCELDHPLCQSQG